MLNSSLLEMLRTFSADELKSFDALVRSPYYNKKTSITRFWNEIKKYAPDFTSVNLKKEVLYNVLMPGKPYNYGTMKNLIYELGNLCEKFIELKAYETKQIDQKLNLAAGLLERSLNNIFVRTMKLLDSSIENLSAESGYHIKKFNAEVLLSNYLISINKHHKTADHIKPLNDYLTMGYFIDIFSSNYNSIFMQNESGKRLPNEFVERVIEYYDRTAVEMDFRVKLYYNSFMLLYKEETKYFDELRKLLHENIDMISQEQKYNFCVALTNFCMKKSMDGHKEFERIEYEVYRFMVENNILSIDGVKIIDGTFYKNVAAAAIRADETKWALGFINKYKAWLSANVRDHYYFRAMIEYHIYLKEFGEVLKYLTRTGNTHFVDKLNLRKWEIITYYELKLFEELRYRIDSTRHFIRNEKKLSDEKKEMLMNLTSFVSKLLTLRENLKNISSSEIEYLKSEIRNSKSYYTEWLIEKSNELIALK